MIDNIHVNQPKPCLQHPISKMIQLLYIKYNIILAFNLKESPMKPRCVDLRNSCAGQIRNFPLRWVINEFFVHREFPSSLYVKYNLQQHIISTSLFAVVVYGSLQAKLSDLIHNLLLSVWQSNRPKSHLYLSVFPFVSPNSSYLFDLLFVKHVFEWGHQTRNRKSKKDRECKQKRTTWQTVFHKVPTEN